VKRLGADVEASGQLEDCTSRPHSSFYVLRGHEDLCQAVLAAAAQIEAEARRSAESADAPALGDAT